MTKDELIDEISLLIYLGIMLGEDTHIIAESLYKKYIAKEEEREGDQ